MTDWLDPGYQQVILRGALEAARERDCKVVCYVTNSSTGSPLDVTATHRLIVPSCADGLVVVAPSLGWGSEAERTRMLAHMQPLPMCVVALEVPKASVIAVDNQSGLASLVEHLVRDHGHRHLAFVRGPEFNLEAEQRLGVFRRVLAEADLAVNEKLVLPGDFSTPSGAKAVELLLGERRVNIANVDAIVAANDGMAMGVMEALEARAIRVPAQVAVTGFDDCADSRYLRAPLTTVRQRMFEQGKHAVRALMDHIRSGEPQRVVLPTELVTRRSCGCTDGIGRSVGSKQLSLGGRPFDLAFIERRQALLAELLRVGRGAFGRLGSGWELKLVSSLVEELKGRSPSAFRDTLDEMLQRLADDGTDPALFHEIVTVLWRNLAPCSFADPDLRTDLELILDGARLATSSAVQRVQGANLVRFKSASQEFLIACARLSAATSIEHLGRLIQEFGPALGISHLDLALCRGTTHAEGATRVLTYTGGRARFPSVAVHPEELPRIVQSEQPGLSALLAATLEVEKEVLGLVVMNMGTADGHVFDPLRASLSTGVKGALLRAQLQGPPELALGG